MTVLQQFRAATEAGARLLVVDHWKADLGGTVREITGGVRVLRGRVLHADGTLIHEHYGLDMPRARDLSLTPEGHFRVDLGGRRPAACASWWGRWIPQLERDEGGRTRHNAGMSTSPPSMSALRARRDEILAAAAHRGASNVAVFGSVARGDADATSDIDILVNLEPGRSMLDLGGLLMDLREVLGRDVDVVTRAGLRSRLRERVLAEATPL